MPVYGKIPYRSFPQKGYEIGIGLLNDKRHLMALRHQVITKFSDEKEMPFYDVLLSQKLPRYVRCSIRNLDTGLVNVEEFNVNSLVKNADKPHLSSIVLTDDNSPDYYPLDMALETQTNHPLEISGKRVKPNIDDHFKANSKMYFYVQLQNRTADYIEHDFYASITMGEKVMSVPVELLYAGDVNSTNSRYMGIINTDQMNKGNYNLWLTFVDKANGNFSTGSRGVFT